MAIFNCNCSCRNNCAALAVVVSVILGVVAAFLQITGVITVAPVFLWVVFGVAAAYLAVLVGASALGKLRRVSECVCSTLGVILAGILGSILFAVVLLAVGIVATSVVSAILVGLLVLSFALVFTGSACYVRCSSDCEG